MADRDEEFADEQYESDLDDDWEKELERQQEEERLEQEAIERKAKENEKFKPKQVLTREAILKAAAEKEALKGVDLTDDAARAEAELQQRALEARQMADMMDGEGDIVPLGSMTLTNEKEHFEWMQKVLAQVQQHRAKPSYEAIFPGFLKATGGLLPLEVLERLKEGITHAKAVKKEEADRLRQLKKEQQAAKERAQGKRATEEGNAGQKSTWNRNVAEVDGYGDDDEGDSAGAPAKAAASRNEDDFM